MSSKDKEEADVSILLTGSVRDEKELILIFNAESLLLDVGCDIGKCFNLNLLTGGFLDAIDLVFFPLNSF